MRKIYRQEFWSRSLLPLTLRVCLDCVRSQYVPRLRTYAHTSRRWRCTQYSHVHSLHGEMYTVQLRTQLTCGGVHNKAMYTACFWIRTQYNQCTFSYRLRVSSLLCMEWMPICTCEGFDFPLYLTHISLGTNSICFFAVFQLAETYCAASRGQPFIFREKIN